MTQEPKIFPYIARLLQGAEVVWKPLGEVVTTITAPTKLNRSEYKQEGLIPIIDQGIDFIAGYTDEAFTPVKSDTYILFGDHSEHIKYVDFAFIQGADGLKILKPKEGNAKYIYYAFINFYHKQLNYKRHWSVAKETIIPLPPLSIQQEIVRILDKFTQLEAELEAELDCRKRQYEYYRNKLLTFNEIGGGTEIVWKTLGEAGTFIRGNGLQKKDLITSGIPAIHYGQIYTYYGVSAEQTISFVSPETAKGLRKVDYGDVIITNTSENIDDVGKAVAYCVKEQGVTGGHATIFKPSEKIIGKYLVYYTQTTEFSNQKRKYAKGTKVIDISANDLAKIIIPLPSLEEQQRIASILDKFDILVNSISEGLPKEIALRRKQYEYYRERLLSFPS
ncbi:restriction endonuclease subunit S [Capnocytophaga sputigena]|uniref:restriction endonuclease subunit S n=1 Tax=Capnocytophaga sputigena TaxID=1019 RepID=UPI0028D6D04A|nr:restriction endonuclease subunit S [Capnocytophaga sputigena]